MKIKDINLFDYNDYRQFLLAYFKLLKANDRQYSYGKWARDIGLSSVSGLTMVLNGQRNAGKKIQEKLVANLELNKEEEKYFRDLVNIQKKVKDDTQLVMYLMNNNDDSELSQKKRPVHFKWEMGLIREATKFRNFNESHIWLKEICNYVTPSINFKNVLDEMKSQEILCYNENKRLIVNTSYGPKEKIDTRYFKLLHHDFLDILKQSYEVKFERRALEYRLMVIKNEDIDKAKERIKGFLNSFAKEFEVSDIDKSKSDIYLTALSFVPLTK